MKEGVGSLKTATYFSVFDGHGINGAKASRFVKQWLPQHLSIAEGIKNGDLTKGIRDAFVRMNKDMSKQDIDFGLSGTTACGVIMNQEKMLIMNVGDSRAIVGYIDPAKEVDPDEGVPYRVQELTRDHKPTLPTEQARIEANGGEVKPIEWEGQQFGPPRVWIAGEQAPGLCMSRSLGDEVGQEVGVVPDPDTTLKKIEFPEDEEMHMVIASDGIWEFIENEYVIDMVRKANNDVKEACKDIIYASRDTWIEKEGDCVDDCSAIVVRMYWRRVAKGAEGEQQALLEPSSAYAGSNMEDIAAAMADVPM